MLTILDIYDAAASIGKDFEALIEQYGSETVSSLMPKVISILEELEEYAAHFDADEREILSLQTTITQLEIEKSQRLQEKDELNQELEQLEEHWKDETSQLTQLIQKLETDNFNLRSMLDSRDNNSHDGVKPEGISIDEMQLMIRLKELIDRQKVEIRGLKRKITQKNIDLEAIQQQADRLAQINAELRRKHLICKKQLNQLDLERSELECQIQTKNNLVREMRENVYCPEEVKDRCLRQQMMEEDTNIFVGSCEEPSTSQLLLTTDPLSIMMHKTNSDFSSGFDDAFTISESSYPSSCQMEKLKDSTVPLESDGKIHPDSNNMVNKPRFTIEELRTVLRERNELRSRLVEVEEELAIYKRAGDDEPPVQGPINREPDNKFDCEESGIKRLFVLPLKKCLDQLIFTKSQSDGAHTPQEIYNDFLKGLRT